MSEEPTALPSKSALARASGGKKDMSISVPTSETSVEVSGRRTRKRAPPEPAVKVVWRRLRSWRISDVASVPSFSWRETTVENDGDVVTLGVSEVPKHSVERAVGDASDPSFGSLAIVIIRAEDFDVLHTVTVPASWRRD